MADTLTVIDEGSIIEIVQGGDLTVILPVKSNIEIGTTLFLQLADTPDTYEDSAGKTVVVNDEGTGLTFAKTYKSFISLSDTPNKYDNAANQLVAVNQMGTGLRFINYVPSDINIEYFTQLADVPQSYEGKAGELLIVNPEEDGIIFSSLNTVIPDQVNVAPGSYSYPKIVVNKKGIITAIEEGKPFQFDPFPAHKLLIGDDTDTPASLEAGQPYQYLMTPPTPVGEEGVDPTWTYVDKLISSGYPTIVPTIASTEDRSTLNIALSNENIEITPSGTQNITIGKGTNNLTLNSNIIIPAAKSTIYGMNGLKIDPANGVVGVTNVSSAAYNLRITDNDFITKSWYLEDQKARQSN